MTAKKSTRLRPNLETLESMLLLSTVVAEVHHGLKPPVHGAPSAPVALVGTVHGTGHLTGGTSATVSGSGSLGKVGSVAFKLTADVTNIPSSVILATKHGELFLSGAGPLLSTGQSGSVSYKIIGGTGQYAGATGSGTLLGSYSLLKGNKFVVTLRFS